MCNSQKIIKGNSLKTYCISRNALLKLKNKDLSIANFNYYLTVALKTQDEYLQREGYKAAAYYYAQTDTILAFKYVKAAIVNGAEVKCINGVFTVSELKILNQLRVKYVEDNYRSEIFSFFKTLRTLDQYYRNSSTEKNREKMRYQDKLNQSLLYDYIKKNNWHRYSAFDTADCSYTISSSLASMISHWDIPYANFIYRSMVIAASQNKLPWFIPITVNNLYFSRKPFISGTYYNFLNWVVSFNRLDNLKIKATNEIDMSDDFTIAEILSLCFRSYNSDDIIVLVPSKKYAQNKENCKIQLEKLRKALYFFGLKELQVKILDFEKNNSILPESGAAITYWNIHYGSNQTISSLYKDTWILDKEFSLNDFNNLFQ